MKFIQDQQMIKMIENIISIILFAVLLYLLFKYGPAISRVDD